MLFDEILEGISLAITWQSLLAVIAGVAAGQARRRDPRPRTA
ncbi:MAG: hypothetical protein R3E68_00665 [Burkholderiaceae bacterium]